MTKKTVKVIFYKVKSNSAKTGLICMKSMEAFQAEKQLLIAAPTLQAAHYIDALLWRFPEESFLPHVVTDMPTAEWIAITLQEQVNVNNAARMLNLCPQPSPLYQQMDEVYEIYDETQPDKLELSKQRVLFYEGLGLSVTIL